MKLYLKNVFVALTFIAAASIVSFGQQIVPVNQVAPTLQERCAFDQVRRSSMFQHTPLEYIKYKLNLGTIHTGKDSLKIKV